MRNCSTILAREGLPEVLKILAARWAIGFKGCRSKRSCRVGSRLLLEISRLSSRWTKSSVQALRDIQGSSVFLVNAGFGLGQDLARNAGTSSAPLWASAAIACD